MATLISHIIDPDNGAGTDYTSLNAWEIAQNRDLPTADEIARANCRASSGSADTTLVSVNGWTTDSTRYIEINGEQLDSAKWDSSKYRLTYTDDNVIDIQEDFVRVNNFQVQQTYSASDTYESAFATTGQTASSNDLRISNSIIKGVCSGTVKYIGMKIDGSNGIVKIWNTIVYGFPRRGMELDVSTAVVYNCIVEGATSVDGYKDIAGTTTCKNCVALNNSNDFDAIDTIDYCASDDGDGTNSVTPSDWSTVFEDWANGDFSLKSTDTDLKDAGTSDPGSGLFSDDIAGDSRSGSWDIGPDEYVTSATIITPSPITTITSGVNPGVVLGTISLTPTQISAITGGVNPDVVLGSLTLTPSTISAIAGRVNPQVVLGTIALTPGHISAITATSAPDVVLGSLSLTPAGIDAIAGSVDPVVILGNISITPQALFAITSGVDPIVIEGGDIIITPTAISAVVDGVDPQVLLGSLSITPNHIGVFTDKNDPSVILGSIKITPAHISAITADQGPEVILGPITITPTQIETITAGLGPEVILGPITITPTQIEAIAAALDPEIILGSINITPEMIFAIIAGIDPTVFIPSPELPRYIFSKKINKTFSKELTKIFEASKNKKFEK